MGSFFFFEPQVAVSQDTIYLAACHGKTQKKTPPDGQTAKVPESKLLSHDSTRPQNSGYDQTEKEPSLAFLEISARLRQCRLHQLVQAWHLLNLVLGAARPNRGDDEDFGGYPKSRHIEMTFYYGSYYLLVVASTRAGSGDHPAQLSLGVCLSAPLPFRGLGEGLWSHLCLACFCVLLFWVAHKAKVLLKRGLWSFPLQLGTFHSGFGGFSLGLFGRQQASFFLSESSILSIESSGEV